MLQSGDFNIKPLDCVNLANGLPSIEIFYKNIISPLFYLIFLLIITETQFFY